jgi:prepilin-type N-terminal cleavage/methylation domain-containing protein
LLPIISMKKIIRTNRAGFTLVEVMMVISILGMLVTVAVPQWMKGRENARRSTCLTNLKKIDEFKEQYAFAHNKLSGDICSFSDLQADDYFSEMPICQSGGTYNFKAIGEAPTCSFTGHHPF